MSVIEPRHQGRLSQPSCSGGGRNVKDGMSGRRDWISAAGIAASRLGR
jgi:hypothetical protein